MFSAPSSSTYSPPLPASRTASQRHAALRFSPTTTAGTNTNRAAQPQPELQGSFVAEQLSRGARQRAAAALRARLTHHLDAALAQPSTCAANPETFPSHTVAQIYIGSKMTLNHNHPSHS